MLKNKSNLTFDNIVERGENVMKKFQNKKIKIDKFCTEKDNIIELNFKDQLMPTVTTVSNFKKSIEENELYNMIQGKDLMYIRILRPMGYGHEFRKLAVSNLVRYSYK